MPRGVNFGSQKGILSVASPSKGETSDRPDKRPQRTTVPITFGKIDLEGTSQPHNDALIITCQVGGFLVKRIMVDQGSGAEIMYPDLYKGLGLKLKALSKYDTPLVGFDGKVVTLEGQIKLLVVNFPPRTVS